ncbi:Uu.00g094000.m01.CDS01 [Anthostomella pinea]|uniref:Uu.00g094000.m01.CDS01 n=1 Tax=Anthostomella pinea TaxID=933095 RepID=A0AAI8VNJ0_9PEZI|nr:Uu.00g094000.m01.CDS01 [Anthostomella pinea]
MEAPDDQSGVAQMGAAAYDSSSVTTAGLLGLTTQIRQKIYYFAGLVSDTELYLDANYLNPDNPNLTFSAEPRVVFFAKNHFHLTECFPGQKRTGEVMIFLKNIKYIRSLKVQLFHGDLYTKWLPMVKSVQDKLNLRFLKIETILESLPKWNGWSKLTPEEMINVMKKMVDESIWPFG